MLSERISLLLTICTVFCALVRWSVNWGMPFGERRQTANSFFDKSLFRTVILFNLVLWLIIADANSSSIWRMFLSNEQQRIFCTATVSATASLYLIRFVRAFFFLVYDPNFDFAVERDSFVKIRYFQNLWIKSVSATATATAAVLMASVILFAQSSLSDAFRLAMGFLVAIVLTIALLWLIAFKHQLPVLLELTATAGDFEGDYQAKNRVLNSIKNFLLQKDYILCEDVRSEQEFARVVLRPKAFATRESLDYQLSDIMLMVNNTPAGVRLDYLGPSLMRRSIAVYLRALDNS